MKLKNLIFFGWTIIHIFAFSISHEELTALDQNAKNFKSNVADTIFHNGSIITMREQNQQVSAVAIRGDQIIALGNFSALKKYIGSSTKMFDLKGKTLMPGFYDSHSHFSLSANQMAQGFDLRSPPMGSVKTIADIIANIQRHIKEAKINPGQTVYGFGYNDESFEEKRSLTKTDLDLISKDHYIIVVHVTGHIGCVNSLILDKMKVAADTKVEGGEIGLGLDGQPNGILKQQALLKFGIPFYKKLTKENILIGEKAYFGAGYTTAHDMVIYGSEIKAYLQAQKQMKIDINGYQLLNDLKIEAYNKVKNTQTNHFHLKGVKGFFDGSIMVYTAALSHPYLPNSQTKKRSLPTEHTLNKYQSSECLKDFCGILQFSNQSYINERFQYFFDNGIDCMIHSNGDAAIDQFIEGVREVRKKAKAKGQPSNKTRFILNHATSIRQDQIQAIKQLQCSISFFPAHTYFWAELYQSKFLGLERAVRISPIKSALNNNIKFTVHNDAPIIPLRLNFPLQIAWSAVNRVTLSGKVVGPELRIPVYSALEALTINAAWQGKEEKSKGSIQVGKKADLIVLQKNPLKIDPLLINKIAVLYTFKNGELVYQNDQILKNERD